MGATLGLEQENNRLLAHCHVKGLFAAGGVYRITGGVFGGVASAGGRTKRGDCKYRSAMNRRKFEVTLSIANTRRMTWFKMVGRQNKNGRKSPIRRVRKKARFGVLEESPIHMPTQPSTKISRTNSARNLTAQKVGSGLTTTVKRT